MMTMKPRGPEAEKPGGGLNLSPWTFKAKQRGRHGGEVIEFYFQGKHYMTQEWYPPWRNELERMNAAQICDDLNAAFAARNRPATRPTEGQQP